MSNSERTTLEALVVLDQSGEIYDIYSKEHELAEHYDLLSVEETEKLNCHPFAGLIVVAYSASAKISAHANGIDASGMAVYDVTDEATLIAYLD